MHRAHRRAEHSRGLATPDRTAGNAGRAVRGGRAGGQRRPVSGDRGDRRPPAPRRRGASVCARLFGRFHGGARFCLGASRPRHEPCTARGGPDHPRAGGDARAWALLPAGTACHGCGPRSSDLHFSAQSCGCSTHCRRRLEIRCGEAGHAGTVGWSRPGRSEHHPPVQSIRPAGGGGDPSLNSESRRHQRRSDPLARGVSAEFGTARYAGASGFRNDARAQSSGRRRFMAARVGRR